jgi:hypothetical protein
MTANVLPATIECIHLIPVRRCGYISNDREIGVSDDF